MFLYGKIRKQETHGKTNRRPYQVTIQSAKIRMNSEILEDMRSLLNEFVEEQVDFGCVVLKGFMI